MSFDDMINIFDEHEKKKLQLQQLIARDDNAVKLLELLRNGQAMQGDRDKVIAIGLTLYQKGGMDELRRVYRLLNAAYPYGDDYFDDWGWSPSELSIVWSHNVGDWVH